MRILILGGTVYLGRHLVDAARVAGHQVTLFNRGQSNPELFGDVERLRGDRTGDLSALEGGRWDVVIDTSGYLPSTVTASARVLRDAIEHYTFVSSISVYADGQRSGLTEDDAVAEMPEGADEVLTGETYGALKVGCERAVARELPGRHAVVRPGLIYGPHDVTDRSRYWPMRLDDGGEVLAPGVPHQAIQLIDVRDLAEWMIRLAEARSSGTFNATGPRERLTIERYLEACRQVAGTDATFTWVDEGFLLEREVAPFSELPLWVPADYHSFQDVRCDRAWSAGLTHRPIEDTLRATLDWARTLPPGPRPTATRLPIGSGLAREREAELLAAWRARSPA